MVGVLIELRARSAGRDKRGSKPIGHEPDGSLEILILAKHFHRKICLGERRVWGDNNLSFCKSKREVTAIGSVMTFSSNSGREKRKVFGTLRSSSL
jgi:hypothetical protein